ncbi:right-handed parallel beta-helix repeat-containing protein [Streptomyces sp. KR80]|uniref:right-handed parallel beta-helix repeat-containing protein n=1 Tax=Streptomyces sp. KR80 TaxID=3457426 RepID=UPI003FD1439B
MSLGRIWRAAAVVAIAAGAALAAPGMASAHEERESHFPDGKGAVPTYRSYPAENRLVVCQPESAGLISAFPKGTVKTQNQRLLKECRFNSIQDAVNAVQVQQSTVYVLPGTYTEDKYAGMKPEGDCDLSNGKADPLGDATSYIGSLAPKAGVAGSEEEGQPVAISYADQLKCPHNLNMIAVMGDQTPDDESIYCDSARCGLQIEGTGVKPEDVVIDGRFRKLNAFRADRAGGLYLRNFSVQQAEFNALYVLETDGFVIDRVTARATDEYGILAFASDHGVIKNTDTYYNGDSGVYPGSASDVNATNDKFGHGADMRYSIEIFNNDMHHNALGYSGTAGNSVHAHHNRVHDNLLGMATDSVFPGHPGMPQDHARWSHNKIWNNNRNYYKEYVQTGACERPMAERKYLEGVVCPVIPMPVGTGVLIAGGNYNLIENNEIWGNWRAGAMQLWAPAPIRDEYDPAKLYDTSNHNHWVGNKMGFGPDGDDKSDLNGIDFWWDDEGVGNCWEGNTSAYGSSPKTNFVTAPASCELGGSKFVPGTSVVKDSDFLTCIQYNRDDEYWRNPPGCSWFEDPKEPTKSDSDGLQPLAAQSTRAEGAVLAGVSGLVTLMTAFLIGRTVVRRRARRGAA